MSNIDANGDLVSPLNQSANADTPAVPLLRVPVITDPSAPSDPLLHKLDSMLHKIDTLLDYVAMIPGIAPEVAVAEGVVHFAEHVIESIENPVDGAAMAAKAISTSTGNAPLDLRLQMIEMQLESHAELLPLIKMALQKLGML